MNTIDPSLQTQLVQRKPGIGFKLATAVFAGLCALFGLIFFVAPGPAFSLHGAEVNALDRTVLNVLGGFLLGFAAFNWIGRVSRSYRMIVSIEVANFISCAAGAYATAYFIVNVEGNIAAWLSLGLFLTMALTFGYLFLQRRSLLHAQDAGTLTRDDWF